MALFNLDKFFAVAAALGDAATSITASAIGAVGYLWDGTNYVRAPGSATNGAKVQVMSAGSAVSLATSTKQSDGTQKTQVVDASGNVQPSGDTAARPIFARQTDGTTAYVGAKTGQLPSALGTQTMTGAVGVTIATDDTLMAAIKADVDKIPSKGTAVMTGATPVTLATDDAVAKALTPSAPATPAAVTGTGSAAALTGAAAVSGVFLQADSTNTTNLRVGDSAISTTRGIQLAPGKGVFWPCTNANQVYVIAESGSPKLNYAVR